MRIALGCMRLSTEADRDDARSLATIHAALDAGITLFDTARAYGLDEADAGHNERLLARALAGRAARVITKGGMRRPEGRARALREDCEASLAALGGAPIEVYLLHAPDPGTPWATSVRALAALRDAGLVAKVGLSNVNRRQLDEALALAPIAAVEVALGPRSLEPLLGGVVERCAELGILVLAHSPLGGPGRAGTLERDKTLAAVGRRHDLSAGGAALAWLIDLHPCVVPVPGATRPETAAACAAAARVVLDEEDRAALRARFPAGALVTRPRPPAHLVDGEVVLIMGVQGAGKSRAATAWEARGYERLNRDQRGGTLRGLNQVLGERLAAGVRRAVLDNTYVTRAQRRDVIETAWRHHLPVRGVWLDTPPAQAQVNVVLRMLAAHGRLLAPEELTGRDPESLPPSAQLRMLRELEPPSLDEGFDALDVVPFTRAPGGGRPGRFIAAESLSPAVLDPSVPQLVFAWRPGGDLAALAVEVRAAAGVDLPVALCPHGGGPPRCWCRPPLPGLPLAFAHAHGVEPAASTLVGSSAAHRALAAALGATFVSA